jgi:hypothetical protein
MTASTTKGSNITLQAAAEVYESLPSAEKASVILGVAATVPFAFFGEQHLKMKVRTRHDADPEQIRTLLSRALQRTVSIEPFALELMQESEMAEAVFAMPNTALGVQRSLESLERKSGLSALNEAMMVGSSVTWPIANASSLGTDRRLEEDEVSCAPLQLICVLEVSSGKFLKNAHVLQAYRHYFACAGLLLLFLLAAWAVFGVLRWCQFFRSKRSRLRRAFIVLMFDVGMIFYGIIATLKAVEKRQERDIMCNNAEKMKFNWENLGERLDHLSEGKLSSFLVSCHANTQATILEIVLTWLLVALIISVAKFLTVGSGHVEDKALLANGSEPAVKPLESVISRHGLLGPVWYYVHFGRVPPEEYNKEVPWRILILIIVCECQTSFSFDLISFFLLQEAEWPGEMNSHFPWKILWELVIGGLIKGLIARVMLAATSFNRTCGFVVVLTFIVLNAALIIAFYSVLWGQLFAFYGTASFGEQLIRCLDVAVGVGLVGFLLTPLSVELVLKFTSTYFWEPCIRRKSIRTVKLRTTEDATHLLQIISEQGGGETADGGALEENGEVLVGNEYVSPAWEMVDVFDGRGNSLKSKSNEPMRPETFDVDDFPVSVELVKKDAPFLKRVSRLGDFVFWVDKSAPVQTIVDHRRAFKTICCCFARASKEVPSDFENDDIDVKCPQLEGGSKTQFSPEPQLDDEGQASPLKAGRASQPTKQSQFESLA